MQQTGELGGTLGEGQPLVQTQTKNYSYEDLLKFETTEIFSGIGKQIVSTKPTAPKFGFGTASREKQQKIYQSKELAKLQFKGGISPGPQYLTTEKFRYQRAPTWHMGTEERNTLNTGPKHDYYLRQDIDFNPLESDKNVRQKPPIARIGLEKRFSETDNRQKLVPGPQYNPSLRPEIPTTSKYTFGFRREVRGQSVLATSNQTPAIVGPGSYIPKEVPKTSEIPLEPKFSIPKAPRFGGYNHGWDKNQTYDTRSRSIGTVYNSKKPNYPQYTIGKQTRDNPAGVFKQDMQQQTKVRIQHPKY